MSSEFSDLLIVKILKSFVATVVLLAVLIGIPILLVTIGIPIVQNLNEQLPYQMVLDSLVVVSWATWIRFSYLIIYEIVQRLHDDASNNPKLIYKNLRSLAGWLVAVALTASTFTQRTSSTHSKLPVSVELVQDASSLDCPPVAFTLYRVQPGDSLWTIADKLWGDPSLWRTIAEANSGDEMTSGRFFDNPAVIFPGWVLKIPQVPAAVHPELSTGDICTASTVPRELARQEVEPAIRFGQQTKDTSQFSDDSKYFLGENILSSLDKNSLSSFNFAGMAAVNDSSSTGTINLFEKLVGYRKIGFGLLGVGIVIAIDRMRRVQMRYRDIGKNIRMPKGEAARIEGNLRHSVNRALATRMDLVLRLAGLLLRENSLSINTVPYIERVRLLKGGIEIAFNHSLEPLLPFCRGSFDDTWFFPASLDSSVLDCVHYEPAPAPALVTLGMSSLGIDLINLEIYGSLELLGEEELTEGAIRAMAVELAGAIWGEYYQLFLIGFGEELHNIAGVRVMSSISDCLLELEQAASNEVMHLRHSGFNNLASARLQDIGLCSAPTLVLCSHAQSQQDTERLVDLAKPLTSGLAVVFSGHVPGACHSLYLSSTDGETSCSYPISPSSGMISPLDDQLLECRSKNFSSREEVVAEEVVAEEVVAEEVVAEEVVAEEVVAYNLSSIFLDESGTVSGIDGDPSKLGDLDELGVSHFHQPDKSVLSPQFEPIRVQTLERDQLSAIGELFDAVRDLSGSPGSPNGSTQQDLHLQANSQPIVEVSVIGPIEIKGDGLADSFSWGKPMELIVYLALHQAGSDTDTWATALWPDRLVAPKTIANALYEARRILGTLPDGSPLLPRHCQRYALKGVTTDWHHFQSLSASDDPAQWHTALTMVRGRPFDGLKESTWTVMEGFVSAIEAGVCDLAIRYSESMFSAGLPDCSAWAARQALVVAPWDERLHRILMRAAYKVGNSRGIEEVMRRLMQILEEEVEPADILQEETLDLYKQLTGEKSLKSLQANASKSSRG